MTRQDDDKPVLVEVGKAVAIAALSAVATGLVNWGIDELKRALKRPIDGKDKEA